MKTYIIAGALMSGVALCWAAKDPVLMTVNGNPVPVSEFEYLYNKNSQQQLSAQPVDEYLTLFEIYKLKVADAKAAGIDTTASFLKDMEGYRRDLAKPYLTDSVFLNNLATETYERSRNEAEASHIMMMKGRDDVQSRAKLDSLRKEALAGADFGQLAYDFSEDRSAKNNRGYYGYITVGTFPLEFEKHAFNLKEGEISEVFETPFAFHVMKGGKKRPARGQVQTAHIMKMVPPGSGPDVDARAKASADSIYNVVAGHPELFAAVARKESDDPGSAQKGGELPWFGAGRMVAEFDSAAFALNVGEISRPVRSQYGYHIIYKMDAKGPEDFETVKQSVIRAVANPQDDRFKMNRDNTLARLSKKHKGSVNAKTMGILKDALAVNGLDSAFYASCKPGGVYADLPVLNIGKKAYPASDFMTGFRETIQTDPVKAAGALDNSANGYLYTKLMETEQEWLDANEPDYHNLLNEYSEGSLLYEVSVEKVWDKAAKDQEGLASFFEANRGNYKWDQPHVKTILVQAKNDSVAKEIRDVMATLGSDTIVSTIRRDFKGLATAEKLLVEQGQNAMVDNIVFGAPEVTPSNAAYTVYFLWDPKVLIEPEDVGDIRGLVTSDYQNELEKDWVEELKARYPVVVNEKELKKLRKKYK